MADSGANEILRQKLDSNNRIIINQALSKLHGVLLEKFPPGKKLINDEYTIPELELLWEKCMDNSTVVANGICSILNSLVLKGCADNLFIITKLTNLALSSTSLSQSSSIVETICFQLTSEIPPSNRLSSSYFNLRSPLHPVVKLLIEKPKFWPIVLEQLKLLLPSNNDSKLQANLSVLMPVLQFVLWDPSRNTGFSSLRLMLLQHLSAVSNGSGCKDLKAFLYYCIFWLQVDCYENVLESSWHLQEIAVLFQNPLYEMLECVETVLLCLTSLCLEMIHYNMDISGCLAIAKLLAKSTQQTVAMESTYATVVILSLLLECSLPLHQSTIIHICSMLLDRDGINSVVMGMLLHPLILVLYSPSAVSTRTTSCLQQEALKLINFIQDRLNTSFTEQSPNVCVKQQSSTAPSIHYNARNFSTQAACAFELTRITEAISNLPAVANDWLHHAHNVLLSSKHIFKSQLYLISSVFLHNLQDFETFKKCNDVLVDAAKNCSDLAPSIFIMMMHKLGIEQSPAVHLYILNSIPHLGIHKLSMNVILPTLRHFMKVSQLQPFAIRLLNSLWQHQERVYPYLFEVLMTDKDNSSISSDTEIDEILVAKAAVILDICKLKPHLYGADLLKILSDIMLSNKNSSGVTPSVIALDSIICLCKAEVVDLRTTWKFLSPIYNEDKRPLVIQKWCEFLSLAELLKLPTADYEVFLNQAVSFLWHTSQKEAHSGAAFRALACFDITRHSEQHIPLQIRTKVDPVIETAYSLKKVNQSSEDSSTSFNLGPYFVELLMNVSMVDLNDYGQFLQALVCQEVKNMPRSVLCFSKTRAAPRGSKKRSTVLQQIPSYLFEKFESNPPPSAIGNLALSLLLAFEPKVNTNSDGSILPQSAIHCGKSYCNMLETLLFKATLDTSDWRKCSLTGYAWGIFMERLFYSMINAHQAQMTLQHRTGNQELNGEENAWLLIRDKICDTLKNAARCNLSVHGNAIIALAGLAAVVNKYVILNVEKVASDVETSEYLLHKNWITDVFTTISNLLKPVAQLTEGIFSWCYLVSGMPTNALQPFAAFSTVLLAPALVHWDIDFISELFLTITLLLYSSPPSSPILQFSLGLSLGQLISQLTMEHFGDVGEEATYILLSNANKLKHWCFNIEDGLLSSRNGGILGLSMIVSSFCQESCSEFKDFILEVIEEFDRRAKSDSLTSSFREVIIVGRVLVATSACGCGILSVDFVKALCFKLMETGLDSSKDNANAIACGLILQYLAETGDSDYIKLKEVQFNNWIKTIKTGGSAKVVAAINAIYSLFPVCLESKFMPGHTIKALEVASSNSSLTDFIRSLSKDLPFTSFDMSVQNCSFWILGATYCCLTSEGSSISGEPMDYSYLENRSTLRSVMDFILQNIKSGLKPELLPQILIALKCLEQDAGQRFPPINWSSLLKPVLFTSKEIQLTAVGIAIAQSRYSSSAAALLTSLLISNSFIQLEECSQIKVFLCLHKLISCLSTKSIHMFLTKHIALVFGSKSDSDLPIQLAIMQGILKSLNGSNSSSGISEILHLAVVDVFHHIDPHVKNVWDLFGKIAVKLPDEVQDQMKLSNVKHHDHILKHARLRAVVVGCRRRPLQWLNECIDALAGMQLNRCESELNLIIAEYYRCFHKYNNMEICSDDCIEVESVNWIFELMGHIRNVMEGRSLLDIENENHMKEVVYFLFIIFGLYITSLAGKESGCDYFLWVAQETALSAIVPQILPTALLHLVIKTSWQLHIKKFIHWFDFLLKSALIEDGIKSSLKACLLHFRQCPEMKIFGTWTHIMELGV